MRNMDLQRRFQGMTMRQLAKAAGLSLGVTSDALTGSCWPRWNTIEALAEALGHKLRIGNIDSPPLYELPFMVSDRGRTLSSVAREIGVRPDTLLEMTRGDRSPSAATVLALTEWCDETMDLDRVRQP
ncbi:helix-turn-helix transcriptional regulator [Aeromicrobium sp. Root472D3]|uniref:helix-turn-helix transcriptional regulator n=1 Tax=Aeromicrobium sp. Root472D3 TaxID=1736540 RepID=UPI0012F7DD49|nr:helix-turn-helix transcriptional regulator [Aeromicrobium sp. Root472D3]